jgi:heat shock protein HslJ
MNPVHLVGTSWRLRSVNDTAHGADSLITLNLTATQISGFAGCRAYTGTYQARSDEIRVTSISMAATECDQGEAALLREGRFTTDLSEASYYRMAVDSLEIVTAPGRRLAFSAQW